MHTAAPFVAALLTVALVALVAGAHDTDLTDPNDAGGRLDVREVRLAHQPGPPLWTIVTFAEWRTVEMWDRGYLMVLLDTQGGPGAEYYLLVRSAGVRSRAHSGGPDGGAGYVPGLGPRRAIFPPKRVRAGGPPPADVRREPVLLSVVGRDHLHR